MNYSLEPTETTQMQEISQTMINGKLALAITKCFY